VIVFLNPHVDDFLGNPPHFKFLKRKALRKYGFILDKTLEQNKYLSVIVDGTISCFIPDRYFKHIPKYFRKLISKVEFLLWLKINAIKNSVKHINIEKDNLENMLLLLFSYKSAVGLSGERLGMLKSFPAVVAHLSHYFISTQEKSDNLSSLPNVWLSGDSDITENAFFQNYFSWYKRKFIVLPFCVASRFKSSSNFNDRKNDCIAAGSFHNLADEIPGYKYNDFMKFFKVNTYHPIRKLIFDNKENANFITSIISPYRNGVKSNYIKRFFDHFMVSQKEYFKIDLVKEYNSHKFAVIGEELSGFPALGAFEAMSCGAILIGLPEAYKGMDFDFDKCCVQHNGTLESISDAMEKVNSFSDNGRSLSEQSELAMKNYFNEIAVYKKWITSFKQILK